jgi:hypothetical protein
MTKEAWLELAKRCEAATGPEREIDVAITLAIHPYLASGPFAQTRLGRWVRMYGGPIFKGAPNYASSIDAITALIERELPGHLHGYLPGGKAVGFSDVIIWSGYAFSGLDFVAGSRGSSPALALCAAFCLAKAASAGDG